MRTSKPKLGVIVPYRNREKQLSVFKQRMVRYLKTCEIPYEIIIVNQDDAKLFNRGTLLNIGFKEAIKLKCDYVVFHDVDMLPSSDVDYSYSDFPVHLATNTIERKTKKESDLSFNEYFGGVTIFPIEDFIKINGYSNKYWGWGYEDTDLLFRCEYNDIKLDELDIKNIGRIGTKLKFNGSNAHIKSKNFNNLLDFNNDLTILLSFYPDDIILNHVKEVDKFTVFSIPGYNTEVSYSSFLRYNFLTFDNENNSLFINSEIKTNYKTKICITFDSINKNVEMYQDGVLIDSKKYNNHLRSYVLEQFFYIGCTINENKDLDNYFKGYFDEFAVFNKKLDNKEINEIGTNESITLTQNFGDYHSANKLKLYYNTNFIKEYKLIDLSGNGNDGEILNCEIVETNFDENKTIKIPYRRQSMFHTLEHDENGFVDNKWKDINTRWNQLKYHNEVKNNPESYKTDGLSSLLYMPYGKTQDKDNNITHINVGI